MKYKKINLKIYYIYYKIFIENKKENKFTIMAMRCL